MNTVEAHFRFETQTLQLMRKLRISAGIATDGELVTRSLGLLDRLRTEVQSGPVFVQPGMLPFSTYLASLKETIYSDLPAVEDNSIIVFASIPTELHQRSSFYAEHNKIQDLRYLCEYAFQAYAAVQHATIWDHRIQRHTRGVATILDFTEFFQPQPRLLRG